MCYCWFIFAFIDDTNRTINVNSIFGPSFYTGTASLVNWSEGDIFLTVNADKIQGGSSAWTSNAIINQGYKLTINCPEIIASEVCPAISQEGNDEIIIVGNLYNSHTNLAVAIYDLLVIFTGNIYNSYLTDEGLFWDLASTNFVQVKNGDGDTLNIYMGDAADVLSGKLAGGVEGTYDPHGGQSFISGCSSIVI